MIRCTVSRGSKAAGRLSPVIRFNSTFSSNDVEPSSPLSGAAEPPHPFKSLPLSPLMDPKYLEARQRHRLPKLKPKIEDLTPFQQQLRNNPYALALSTPVRQCNVTKQVLPTFFLQGYNLLAHPETGVPWWMPSGLTRKHKGNNRERSIGEGRAGMVDQEHEQESIRGKGLGEAQDIDKEHSNMAEIPMDQEFLSGVAEALLEDQTSAGSPRNQVSDGESRLLGPTIYTILRKDFLSKMYKNKGLQRAFMDSQLLKNARSRQLFSNAQFRSDIDEFLLKLMRRRSVEDLTRLVRLKRGYVVGCKSWEDALAKKQVGAYLWTGGEDVPAGFSTLDVGVTKKQKVPVHNLRLLLGKKHLEELRAEFLSGIFENEVLALKHRKLTLELQMRLWKLQGYLADYRESTEVP